MRAADENPRPNGGKYPAAALDLCGATRRSFWARGENGAKVAAFLPPVSGATPVPAFPSHFSRIHHVRPPQNKLFWKSTEDNIDVFATCARLHAITNDPCWQARAHHAHAFVESLWDESEGRFGTGMTEDGVTTNKSIVPLEMIGGGSLPSATPRSMPEPLNGLNSTAPSERTDSKVSTSTPTATTSGSKEELKWC